MLPPKKWHVCRCNRRRSEINSDVKAEIESGDRCYRSIRCNASQLCFKPSILKKWRPNVTAEEVATDVNIFDMSGLSVDIIESSNSCI